MTKSNYYSNINLKPKLAENVDTVVIKNNDFNYPLTFLTETVLNLELVSENYNLPIELSLKKLDTLNLSLTKFNNEIHLPQNLKEFKLNMNLSNLVNNLILPQNLTLLDISYTSLNNEIILPKSLIVLSLRNIRNCNFIDYNNLKLEKILLCHLDNFDITKLDNEKLTNISLTSINYYFNINYFINAKQLEIQFCNFNQEINLPQLENLKIFDDKFNVKLGYMPKLKKLNIYGVIFNMSLDNLSIILEELYLTCENFNKPLDLLPNSLKILYLGSNKYTQKLDDLPISLHTFIFEIKKYDHPMNNLPLSINTLNIKCEYSKNINLPSKLEILYLPSKYRLLTFIPKSLKFISQGNYNKKYTNDSNTEICNVYINEHLITNQIINYYNNIKTEIPLNLCFYVNSNYISYEELSKMYDI